MSVCAVALAGLLLAASRTIAPEPEAAVALHWELDGCDADETAQRGEELGLRHDPTSPRRASIALHREEGTVTAHVRVEVDDVVLDRELTAEGCAVAADAALLVVGAQLRVLESETPTRPEPPTIATPKVASEEEKAPVVPAVASTPAAPPPQPGAWWIGAAGAASFGPVPRPTSRFALAVSWQHRLARVQLEAAHHVRRTVSVTPEADVQLMAFGAALRGGVAPRWQTLRFPVLLGVEIDDIVGRANGRVLSPTIGHAPWLAATLDAGVFWAVHDRVGLELMGGPSVVLASRRFALRDADGSAVPVPRAPLVGGRVGLAIFFRVR